MSHPTMGAWIEIKVEYLVVETRGQSHPTMGAWIEIRTLRYSITNTT